MDKIGVVRDHRWIRADEQAAKLQPRCRIVVSLDGGKVRQATRDDLVTWARKGTVFEFVHAFLLADQSRKRLSGGLRKDFRAALAALQKRGAEVFDLTADIGSKKRLALLAVVDTDIGRSVRSRSSAANVNAKRGRKAYEPTKDELRDGKAIWRDLIEFPEWGDADKALRTKVNKLFTAARAYKLWGPRKPTKP